jgi:hypothetical protein
MSRSRGPEYAFLRSILHNSDKAVEKCRKYINGEGRNSPAWVASLLALANGLSREQDSLEKQRLQLALAAGGLAGQRLPVDIMGIVFSYLSPQVAVCMQRVNKRWRAIQTLHVVPWTVGPHTFLELPYARRRALSPSDKSNILTSGFTKHAVSFCFGSAAPTTILMRCIEHMSKLKRLQMPTCSNGKRVFNDIVFAHRYVELLISARGPDITHLAVSLRPCIDAVCRFPNLTSLLVSFGIATPVATIVSVESFLLTVTDSVAILPHLQHFGLHHCAQVSDISVNRVVALLEGRPGLITLSLTGMFSISRDEISRLLHPACGLRSLAVNVPNSDDGVSWHIDDLLEGSPVSLFVLCRPGSGVLLPKTLLWSMFLARFEPIRCRGVRIDGQRSYEAHPFRRLAATDVVWGLTGGSIFAA